MARKSITDFDPALKSVVDEFKSVSEVKYDIALDAYNAQDDETQRVIDRIVAYLQTTQTGYITVTANKKVIPVKIENKYLGFNLLYLAVEIVKDLAFLDIRVANFTFPPQVCSLCGADLTERNVHHVGKGKRK